MWSSPPNWRNPNKAVVSKEPQSKEQPIEQPSTTIKANPAGGNLPNSRRYNEPTPGANRVPPSFAPPKIPTPADKKPVENPVEHNESEEYISHKICNLHTSGKVIDFNGNLRKAKVTDYANIHGCGGKGHAPNSTIGLVICDFSSGDSGSTAPKSKNVSVKYALDVTVVPIIAKAAMDASTNCLCQPTPPTNYILQSLQMIHQWKQNSASNSDMLNIHKNDIDMLDQTLSGYLTLMQPFGKPVWSYSMEKNDPYRVDDNGKAPVSSIEIKYIPIKRDGTPSIYPWMIGIRNYWSTLVTHQNGLNTHNRTERINEKSAYINLTAQDFAAAMNRVMSYIHIWETYNGVALMSEASLKIEELRKKQK